MGRPYREEGLKEGIEQGIELGEARLLKRLLTKTLWPDARLGCGQELMRRPPISSSCGLSRFWMPIR